MELLLECIPPECVSRIWRGPVHDLIDAGFASSDVPMPDDLLEQLRYGTRLLWVVTTPDGEIVAAMLTQIFEMRSGKLCKMLECGGSRLEEWAGFCSRIEQYAKAEGCYKVMVVGRPGWSRVLHGFKIASVTLEKRI